MGFVEEIQFTEFLILVITQTSYLYDSPDLEYDAERRMQQKKMQQKTYRPSISAPEQNFR